MAPVLAAGGSSAGAFEPLGRAGAQASTDAWVSPWRDSLVLHSSSSRDDLFADLGGDSDEEDRREAGTSTLLESRGDDLRAAAAVRSGEEATQAKVPRRSRMQRYERDLDAWFAELAVGEAVP